MLLEFTVRNFKSLRREQKLSLYATSGSEHLDTHSRPISGTTKHRVLNSAVVYGANASGKSNLLLAVNAMRDIVLLSSTSSQRGDVIDQISPFRLSSASRESPTLFEVVFIHDSVRYQYGFEATRDTVIEEWLYAFPKRQAQRWFVRRYDAKHPNGEFIPGGHLRGRRLQAWESTRANALYLSTAVQLNNESLAPIFDWFKDVLRYLPGGVLDEGFTSDQCGSDKYRGRIVDLLKYADFGILDVFIKKQRIDEFPKPLTELLTETGQLEIFQEKLSRVISFQHSKDPDEANLIRLNEESRGTQRFFALSGPILNVLEHGLVLVADELGASLHPVLVQALVGLFNDPRINRHGAQLVFNTHETAFLDQHLLRRDQIWFTEKDRVGETQLVPLTDFNPRKGTEALRRNYLNGRYGGVPFVRLKESLTFSDNAEEAPSS